MRLTNFTLLLLILAGFALRLHYLIHSHPFFDEYTTVLAARQILRHGWPLLPSGLFYEHGLLATYLITPFTALYLPTDPAGWEAAHWGLMLSRWPSLLVSVATIPLLFAVGRALFRRSDPALASAGGWLAAGLFALSPEGMVWGGRARMYALATLLILLAVYWAYRGTVYPAASARYRWLALVALLATLLTQFGALMLLPALTIAMLLTGWLSWRTRQPDVRPWFLRPALLLEGAALGAIIGLAILVKRLGRPLGFEPLAEGGGESLLPELFRTIAYQTTFHFTWADTGQFLARQFGVPHHLWLTLFTVVAGLIVAMVWLGRPLTRPGPSTPTRQRSQPVYALLFLWLIFGLLIVEMVTLLEPFRRNPRYLEMYLPLFYLAAAYPLLRALLLLKTTITTLLSPPPPPPNLPTPQP